MLETLLQQYKAGGMTMHLILVLGGIGLWIALERMLALRGASTIDKEEVLSSVSAYILQGQLDKAISACSQIKSPLTNIINAGLVAVKNGKDNEQVQTAMDAVALREIPIIEKRISLLSTFAILCTLAGLLGTVIGMMGAFTSVANVMPLEKAAMLSAKMSMSLNCAAFGFLFAIPLLGIHGWFKSWSESLVDDIHEVSVSTMNFILSNKEKIK